MNAMDAKIINAFLTDTKRYEASGNEVNVFSNVKSSLESISSEHEKFLSGSLDDLDVSGDGIAKKYYTANTKYNGLIDKRLSLSFILRFSFVGCLYVFIES